MNANIWRWSESYVHTFPNISTYDSKYHKGKISNSNAKMRGVHQKCVHTSIPRRGKHKIYEESLIGKISFAKKIIRNILRYIPSRFRGKRRKCVRNKMRYNMTTAEWQILQPHWMRREFKHLFRWILFCQQNAVIWN